MSPGARNGPLLDVDGLARGRRGAEEVGLPAQEGRDLDHVKDAGGGFDLRRLMDVGQDGDAERILDLGQDGQAFGRAGSAEGPPRGAVGLVVGGLEDERQSEAGGDVPEAAGQAEGVGARLDDARPGDQEEPAGRPERDARTNPYAS